MRCIVESDLDDLTTRLFATYFYMMSVKRSVILPPVEVFLVAASTPETMTCIGLENEALEVSSAASASSDRIGRGMSAKTGALKERLAA